MGIDDEEVKRREAKIKSNEILIDHLLEQNEQYSDKRKKLIIDNEDLTNSRKHVNELISNFIKDKNLLRTTQLTLKEFLENINNYPNLDFEIDKESFFYKGVLINSFYDLEFHNFPKTDNDLNEILRCRCVSIGVPNIRKNYTSLNFNGRRVEIEQNAEFQHEIQIKIICDEDANIYYKFKEYIDCTKENAHSKLFNGAHIWICLDGFKLICLKHITIADLGQLEFDNSPNSSICFFNVSLKVIDYEFNSKISQKNEYDDLLEKILNEKNNLENIEKTIRNNYEEIDKLNYKINENDLIMTGIDTENLDIRSELSRFEAHSDRPITF